MEILRFAHRFFHFEQAAWQKALDGHPPTWEFARSLFERRFFSQRQLQEDWPGGFQEARLRFEKIRAKEDALGIRVMTEGDPEYPEAISAALAPSKKPALLYLRGAPLPDEIQLAAIVGTRHPSALGRDAAASFAAYFQILGVKVVSGLAKGIDAIAHEETISQGTIAVLGSGVADIYPTEHEYLAERILQAGGSLFSPFPLGQVPLPQNFPERNELIAALSTGVVMIEGAEKSGAAITARQALSMGKCAVVLAQDFRTDFGRGAIRLQQEGATFVSSEEEAVAALYQRFGGFPGALPKGHRLPRRRTFSLADFQRAAHCDFAQAATLLEEAILVGKIERTGKGYRLR